MSAHILRGNFKHSAMMWFSRLYLYLYFEPTHLLWLNILLIHICHLCPRKIDRCPLFSEHMHLKFQLLLTYHKKSSSSMYIWFQYWNPLPLDFWCIYIFLIFFLQKVLIVAESLQEVWLTRSTGSLSTIYSFLSTCFLQSRGLITVIPIWLIGLIIIIIITFNTKFSL